MRRAAAQALGQLGRADEAVLKGLLALAGDEKVAADVRSAAAEALGQLGRADEVVLKGLLALARMSKWLLECVALRRRRWGSWGERMKWS